MEARASSGADAGPSPESINVSSSRARDVQFAKALGQYAHSYLCNLSLESEAKELKDRVDFVGYTAIQSDTLVKHWVKMMNALQPRIRNSAEQETGMKMEVTRRKGGIGPVFKHAGAVPSITLPLTEDINWKIKLINQLLLDYLEIFGVPAAVIKEYKEMIHIILQHGGFECLAKFKTVKELLALLSPLSVGEIGIEGDLGLHFIHTDLDTIQQHYDSKSAAAAAATSLSSQLPTAKPNTTTTCEEESPLSIGQDWEFDPLEPFNPLTGIQYLNETFITDPDLGVRDYSDEPLAIGAEAFITEPNSGISDYPIVHTPSFPPPPTSTPPSSSC